MPIYEYLCRDCHTVYQFLSRRSSPKAPPACPRDPGHAPLERQLSGFSIGAPSSPPSSAAPPQDEAAVQSRMEGLLSRLDGMDEGDPRLMGRLMREMSEVTGESDPAMEEAIRRLEGGEDPERVEELLERHLGDEGGPGASGSASPRMDSGLYEM